MPEPQPEKTELSFPLERYPGINRFALDRVRGVDAANSFLPRASHNAAGARDPELVAELIASNARWGNDVHEVLTAWRDGETATIIAGQQVGFAGGPFYTLAKIASMLRLRRDLEKSGRKATVFFWLATEDHDYDEVSTLTLWQRDELHLLRATERPRASYSVGGLPVPASLRRQYEQLTGDHPDWLRDEITFAESFARLLAQVLEGQRVVLVDSLSPALRKAGKDLFLQIIDHQPEMQKELTKRTEELRRAGYAPQVEPHEDGEWGLLHFLSEDGERRPLRFDGTIWRIGEDVVTFDVLRERVMAHPEQVSTGALVRPLLQDVVFDTDVFVGGPAEVAYYAQVAALHQLVGRRLPDVQLRGHALVAPQKRLRTLNRYGIDPARIFDGVETIAAGLDPARLSEADRIVKAASASLAEATRSLDQLLAGVDESVRDSVGRSERHLSYHLQKLAERTRRAIGRREAERFDAIAKTVRLLAPDGRPQDRIIAWISLWQMYGRSLLERLVETIEPNQAVVKIVGM
jgi:bacillithiol biosynthesis cysteine-adding enzyme BshC